VKNHSSEWELKFTILMISQNLEVGWPSKYQESIQGIEIHLVEWLNMRNYHTNPYDRWEWFESYVLECVECSGHRTIWNSAQIDSQYSKDKVPHYFIDLIPALFHQFEISYFWFLQNSRVSIWFLVFINVQFNCKNQSEIIKISPNACINVNLISWYLWQKTPWYPYNIMVFSEPISETIL